MTIVASRRRSEDGASAVEYGLLAALIAGVVVFAVLALGIQVTSLFKDTCDSARDNGNISASCS